MATFTVWKFQDPDGAARAEEVLSAAAHEGLVKILDHAVISWPVGADKPELQHKTGSGKKGAAWGALWGVLGGALFLVPVAGAVVGAGIGALAKSTKDVGITEGDLERIRTEITEGTSGLFLITDAGKIDQLGNRFHARDAQLIHTNLTDAERETLLETFGHG